jgi:hypothetical protein
LEALAFRMAGSTVLGPTDPRVTETACVPIPPQHALSVLTLEPSSLAVGGDGRSCEMEVKDGSLDTGHWTENHGEAEIESEDLGTHAAALAFQRNQSPFLPVSTLVHTAEPGDRLLTDATKPEWVTAVHGANYVTLDVIGVTAGARGSPGWLYREQRLALEAAGATIVPAAGTPPDPVVLGPLKKGPTPDERWNPPAHNPPAFAAVLDPFVLAIDIAARHRFLALALLMILPPVGLGFLATRAKRTGRPRVSHVGLTLASIGFAIFNMVAGTMVANWLIYRVGAAGSATITASELTSIQYNNQNVSYHDVLLHTADGKMVETSFEDDDFNVFPSRNNVIYPGEGDKFTVRYLPNTPAHFVIISNDDSPWAKGIRCDGLMAAVSNTSEKTSFAPGNKAYRAAYDDAMAAARDAGCGVTN